MLYLAVFFILILYILLFVVRIKAAIDYIRNKQDEWIKISFYTRKGFIRYEYEVPLVKKKGDKVSFKLVKGQGREMRGGSEKNDKLMPYDIVKKYISVRQYLKDHGSLFEDIRKYINRHDIHVELDIKLKQGTGDAAQTGLICGLLWSAAGIFTSYISRYLKTVSKRINIVPCFNKKIFEVDASCIFHVRLVHIIVVLKKIYYMKYLIKMKAKKTIGGEVSG
jgi:uncharacterized protein YjhX (UPF0386 family)